MKIYWVFIMLAIICALFSDDIDKAVKADKGLKKAVTVFGIAALCFYMITIAVINLK